MTAAYVIKKKPLLYKLGAKVFRYLRECNKIVEYEKLGVEYEKIRKAIEISEKFRGCDAAMSCVDELNKEEQHGSKE